MHAKYSRIEEHPEESSQAVNKPYVCQIIKGNNYIGLSWLCQYTLEVHMYIL